MNINVFVNDYSKRTGTFVKMYDERIDFAALREQAVDYLFELFPSRFAELYAQNCEVDTSCDPVWVYKRNGKMIAWWDCENMHGYVVS